MDNKVLYKKQAFDRIQRVWFVGDCALKEGVGVCFEHGFIDTNQTDEVATAAFGFRGRAVMLPRTLNALFFAGVTRQAYAAAPAGAKGQPIDILLPGGDAKIQTAVSVTAVDTSYSNGHVQCQWKERTVSGTHANAVISGKTITLSGETWISNGVLAGDVVYISAGTGPKTGGYVVESTPTAETILTLTNAPGDYAGVSVGDLVFVVIVRGHASGTFYNAAASGVFVDATGYGKSAAYAEQSGTYGSTANLLLARLEDGNDDTGVIA